MRPSLVQTLGVAQHTYLLLVWPDGLNRPYIIHIKPNIFEKTNHFIGRIFCQHHYSPKKQQQFQKFQQVHLCRQSPHNPRNFTSATTIQILWMDYCKKLWKKIKMAVIQYSQCINYLIIPSFSSNFFFYKSNNFLSIFIIRKEKF